MNIEDQYIKLLKEILKEGTDKSDRTGTGTLSVFGKQLRHKMSCGFPLLTTKKVPLKTVATELIWMLMGRTDLRWLVERKCNIWVGDAYKAYKTFAESQVVPDWDVHIDDPVENKTRIMTKAEFIAQIITDDKFSKRWGELGPIYGKQWRSWEWNTWPGYMPAHTKKIDQIQTTIDQLKTNPDSRRIMVTAWNPTDLPSQTLPPCHYGFQVYTRELSLEERIQIYLDRHAPNIDKPAGFIEGKLKTYDIPTREISLMWNQRSADVPLGLPFDIASYAILLEILAKECNMVSDELICNLGDCHIYKNQIEGATEQVTRKLYDLPSLQMKDTFHYLFDDVKKPFTEKIEYLTPDMFVINNYEYHPKIDYPLSN